MHVGKAAPSWSVLVLGEPNHIILSYKRHGQCQFAKSPSALSPHVLGIRLLIANDNLTFI